MSNRRPRICFAIPSLRGGGAERVLVNLLGGLRASDIEMTLLVNTFSGPYTELVPREVRVVELKARRLRSSLLPIIRALKVIQPDVVVANLWELNVLVTLARKLSGGRYALVLCEHNSVVRSRNRLVRAVLRGIYPMADLVVGVSEGIGRELLDTIGLPKDKVRIVGNPVVSAQIRALMRAPLDQDVTSWLDPEIPVVMGAGRLVRQKRFDVLLEALSILKDRLRFQCVILGEGPEREGLQWLAERLKLQDRVKFLGFRSNPYRYLSRASLFILSSDYEGLPTVLIEAAACGVPVVSTDCPHGPYEILQGGRCGSLVRRGDPEALAAAIEHCLTRHEDETRDVVQRAIESVAKYTVEYASRQYLEIIYDLALKH